MHWLDTSAAQALAQSLLHFLWEGAAIAMIAAAMLRVSRGSRVRYAIAVSAMIAMPVVFTATFLLLLPHPGFVPGVARAVPAGIQLAAGASRFPSIATKASLPWTIPLWLTGVMVCYLRSMAGWTAAQRMRRTGVCDAPGEWRTRLDRLATSLRISRPVVLLESALAEVPVVIGFLKPVILMPAGLLAGLPVAQVEAILIHELAHIRRWDYLVNLAQSVVEGLLFYHPAVWWVGKTIRAERENCCDDTVIEMAGDPRTYAAALTTLEEIRCASREPALAATGGNLMKRIRRILRQPERRGAISPALCAGVLTVLAAAILAAWQAPAPQSQLPGPYRAWLNEDVAYIVTDAERAEFRALSTKADLEGFIERFWQHRDPTPGSVENEFKEEHYRRIAYTNERFGSSIAGWKTDRGRIYIMYGPADEVEAHPSGGPAGVPSEAWKYRYIEGLGREIIVVFRDANRNGEYRLEMAPPTPVRIGIPRG